MNLKDQNHQQKFLDDTGWGKIDVQGFEISFKKRNTMLWHGIVVHIQIWASE